MIITPGLPDLRRAQRGDRHRAGIAGIVLVDVPGGQQPYPGGQLGRHVQHPLTGGQQLLGQQMPQPARAFHRPGRSGHARAHPSSRSAWTAEARTRSWPSGSSAALTATAVWEASCGSTPIITTAMTGISFRHPGMKTVTGTPNSRDNTRAPSFEPRHGEAPARRHVVRKPSQRRAGSGYESQTCRDLSTLRARLTAIPARPRNAYKQLGGYRACRPQLAYNKESLYPCGPGPRIAPGAGHSGPCRGVPGRGATSGRPGAELTGTLYIPDR